MANIQGANLVVDMGHGYGWPSPYPSVTRTRRMASVFRIQTTRASVNQTKYYGGNWIRGNWILAPDAIVVLNHMCYTAGNGEPGMALPSGTWPCSASTTTRRRSWPPVPELSLPTAARAFNKGLHQLMTTNDSIADIFTTPGSKPNGYMGYVGADARQFHSVRMPGNTNFLDLDPQQGFRACGHRQPGHDCERLGPGRTHAEQRSAGAVRLRADGGPDVGAAGGSSLPLFTPNGDGVSDELDMSYTVDREAFVDITVTNANGNVVRIHLELVARWRRVRRMGWQERRGQPRE